MSSIVSKDTLPFITPNKKNLNELIMRYKGHNENNESPLLKYTIYPESSMGGEYGLFHPNPKLYKVYYYIYFDGCKYEGDELFKEENAISLKKSIDLREELAKQKKYMLVYFKTKKRFDPENTPWKWDFYSFIKDQWAPPFEQDTDEEFNGHK